MGFYQAGNCLALFLALMPVMCEAFDGCSGTNGKLYNIGDQMPSTHPCETDCICKGINDVRCNLNVCVTPPCANPIKIEGKCCPVCACEENGSLYKPGSDMKTANICEMNCICGDAGQKVCSTMACQQCEHPLHVAGECCPRCICKENEKIYNVGQVVSQEPCRQCTCQTNGQVECTTTTCPSLPCKYNVVLKEKCCPVCQCMRGYRRYLPGDIVVNSTCKPQVCQLDGSIKIEPVKCPDQQLQCADPVIPKGKCCPECPNGMTCAYGRNIIQYGDNKVIGTKLCRCEGYPWFPNAFCTEMNVSARLLKYFGNYLAPYKP
ncbi:hypothetical protein ACJMK2_029876 [Sinanodonta woodiana]|uniref:VWFC domain-containing protein n=1 Tax=Sinanodonta woodiana TaxID=1069815 RepID=A0ABD3XFJ7_SINWO